MVFYSNYDGSGESYFEDFVTKARWGQTGVWSNGKGFPKTVDLLFEGAKDATPVQTLDPSPSTRIAFLVCALQGSLNPADPRERHDL